VAVNEAEEFPAATVTEAGTVSAGDELVSATTAPPLGAAAFSTTVQADDDTPRPSDAGAHATALGLALAVPADAATPPVPLIAKGCPVTEAPNAPLTPIAALDVEDASPTWSVATTPLPMLFALSPERMHVKRPTLEPQAIALLAATALAPAVAAMDTTAEGE
jgi:hypothetical protein